MATSFRRDRGVRFNPDLCCRQFKDCPPFTFDQLPRGSRVVIPPDGGFWVVDQQSGVRYRRLTMADIPRQVTFNTRGKAVQPDDD